MSTWTIASAAVGVGIAAAAIALFPDANMSAVGAVIGAIAPAVGLSVFFLTTVLVIAPIVEKVSTCFAKPSVDPVIEVPDTGTPGQTEPGK